MDSGQWRPVHGQNYEKMGYIITIDRILPRVVKNFTPKNSPSLPFGPPIPWNLETFPFLLLIFIIQSHL